MRIRNLSVLIVAMLGIAACGSKPPPPPVTPPAPGGQYGFGGAGCGGVGAVSAGGGQAYGNLTPQFGGGTNTIYLTYSPVNGYGGFNPGPSPQNVLGSGCIQLGDLPGIYRALTGYQAQVSTAGIAISSSYSGVPSAGQFYPQNAGLSVTMSGVFPIQLVSPFGGYPGSYGGGMGQQSQETITVTIGPSQGGGPSAGVPNNHLQGQVLITIGSGGASSRNTIPYYAP